jgi:hypothetical protein
MTVFHKKIDKCLYFTGKATDSIINLDNVAHVDFYDDHMDIHFTHGTFHKAITYDPGRKDEFVQRFRNMYYQ